MAFFKRREPVGNILCEILDKLETKHEDYGIKVESNSIEICRQYDLFEHECMLCSCIAEVLTIDEPYLRMNDLQKLAFYKNKIEKDHQRL